MRKIFFSNKGEGDSEWISISDLMSVLMMIFLFIAISYMQDVQKSQKSIKKVAVAYQELQADLYNDLWAEFKDDLEGWKAEIDRETLTIRFQEPDVLFRIGSANINTKFMGILDDFFPRYVNIISSDKYQDNIDEIRIEGHTSSEWNGDSKSISSYFNNMSLSQDRTRSVLSYCIGLIQEPKTVKWALRYITANGLSSSRLIYSGEGKEDKRKSRRVEFRTKTNAEKKIVEIIERMEGI